MDRPEPFRRILWTKWFSPGGDYEKVHEEALTLNSQGLFWDPVLRVAAPGQMENDHEARGLPLMNYSC